MSEFEEFSLDMRRALQDQHSDDIIVTLLTFTRPGDPETVRISSDRTVPLSFSGPKAIFGTRSRGEEFIWLPLTVAAPAYGESVIPQFRVNLDMVDREIVSILRLGGGIPADCTVEIVRAADPDFVAIRHKGYQLKGAPWNNRTAQLVIRQRAYDTEPYPCGTMNPSVTPGLFP